MQISLLEQVKSYARTMKLGPGDRLPSERVFARDLKVSRNTLRRLLHMLEGRGFVDIRKGSGTYLNTRFFSPSAETETSTERAMADQLETALLLFPPMAALACRRMDVFGVDRLRRNNVALGRSIFSKNPMKFWLESLAFFRLIARGTGNGFMSKTVEEIYAVDMEPFRTFSGVSQKQRESLFAGHVNILNAINKKDREKAGQVTADYIRDLAGIIGLEKNVLPGTLGGIARHRTGHNRKG